jgi:hypothetical protein
MNRRRSSGIAESFQQRLDRIDGIEGPDLYDINNIDVISEYSFFNEIPILTTRDRNITHSPKLGAAPRQTHTTLNAELTPVRPQSQGLPSAAILRWLEGVESREPSPDRRVEEIGERPLGSREDKSRARIIAQSIPATAKVIWYPLKDEFDFADDESSLFKQGHRVVSQRKCSRQLSPKALHDASKNKFSVHTATASKWPEKLSKRLQGRGNAKGL